MAFFKTIDILKRNNAAILIDIVLTKSMMTIGKKSDGTPVVIESIRLGKKETTCKDELSEYCLVVKE
jgi:hypothetical protein